jgi:hypothetical protein
VLTGSRAEEGKGEDYSSGARAVMAVSTLST